MAPKNRIIIDTDPGVDDTLALLLALSASPEDLEVLLLSVTYGNVPLESCLRNVVALFHVLEKEIAWRNSSGRPEGYAALRAYKPIVAVGAKHPLQDELLKADYFHGSDGLHGVHEAHPDLSPADTWKSLFGQAPPGDSSQAPPPSFSQFFTPSTTPSHKEMLRILREEPAGTVSIVAVGPLTNVALAANEDPETFLRAKELVVMGGTVNLEGNVTPVAEFNCYADATATARVYALTSPTPSSTMPPEPADSAASAAVGAHAGILLKPYPDALSRRLKLSLMPLDITTPHLMTRSFFTDKIRPLVAAGSPLARWVETFMIGTFDKIESLEGDGVSEPGLSLHDPLCVWYMLTHSDPAWRAVQPAEDIRVETSGQWTRGMHVVDRRIRKKPGEGADATVATHPEDPMDAVEFNDVPGDTMGWLNVKKGNRINRIIGTPGEEAFAGYLFESVFS